MNKLDVRLVLVGEAERDAGQLVGDSLTARSCLKDLLVATIGIPDRNEHTKRYALRQNRGQANFAPI